MLTEKLLQFIWLHRLYRGHSTLKTTDGESLLVIHPGFWNVNAGPDFHEAKIRIGNTLWVGPVEIHLRSSDWQKHGHAGDQGYARLILHVVYEHDAEISTNDQSAFPTLELQSRIDQGLLHTYHQLMSSVQFIPCAEQIRKVRPITLLSQRSRMLAERLEEKTALVQHDLQRGKHHWQELFYIQLARGFGLHINQDAFEQLARITPLHILGKHKHHLFQVEAILFGQAGFLSDYFDHPYPVALQLEYSCLRKLYNLQPMDKHRWKFLRLRPANFPTLRIAEFARLIADSSRLFTRILDAESLHDLEALLQVGVSDFWLDHFHFHEQSRRQHKALGTSFIHALVINAIVPLLFLYGRQQGREQYCEKALQLMEKIPAEHNAVIRQWQAIGIHSGHAADTQALLQLKNKYCDARRCLECHIGYEVLRGGSPPDPASVVNVHNVNG